MNDMNCLAAGSKRGQARIRSSVTAPIFPASYDLFASTEEPENHDRSLHEEDNLKREAASAQEIKSGWHPEARNEAALPYPGIDESEGRHPEAPMWLHILSLEELGLLYILERCGNMTREAALAVARHRGMDDFTAKEAVDFFFSRIKPNGGRTATETKNQGLNDAQTMGDEPSAESQQTLGLTHPDTEEQGSASDGTQKDQKAASKARKSGKPRMDRIVDGKMVLGFDDEEVLLMTVKGGEPVSLRKDFVAQFEATYPALDVVQELRKMALWLRANPTKGKTHKGLERFVGTWLGRAMDFLRTQQAAIQSMRTRNGFGTGGSASMVAPVSGRSEDRPTEAFDDIESDGLHDF